MNLLILNNDAQDYLKILEPKYPEVTIHAAENEEAIGSFIEQTDILLTIHVSDEFIKKASKLKWVQAMTTGTDYIDNLPSLKKEVLLTSTRGIHGPQMSELAIMLMIALGRKFPQMIRNQDNRIWDRWPARLLYQKKVGILGVGMIGEAIARKCKAFEMTTYGLDPVKREIDAIDHFYGLDKLNEVMGEVDYFICVAPSTPQNQKMIGAETLSQMQPSAYFINIGRGELVDEEALVRTLSEKRIAGAALDTFWKEPLPSDHPFWGIDNVIITPHVGGMSDIYVHQVLSIFEENLRRFLKGERSHLINLIERV